MSDFSVEPKPLLAHWGCGLIVTSAALLWARDANNILLLERALTLSCSTSAALVLLLILSYIVGQFFDAIRDFFIEWLIDRKPSPHGRWKWATAFFGVSEMNWGEWITGNEGHLKRIETWYFTYYMLGVDLGLGLLALSLTPWPKLFGMHSAVSPALKWTVAASGLLFLLDGLRLRGEMAERMNHTVTKE